LALKQNHILMTQQGMMSSPRKNKNWLFFSFC
jgi:hypothetical protein